MDLYFARLPDGAIRLVMIGLLSAMLIGMVAGAVIGPVRPSHESVFEGDAATASGGAGAAAQSARRTARWRALPPG